MKNEPIIVEHTYNAPIEMVWKAITHKDEMKKWYFDLPAFKPEVGFEFTFEGGDGKQTFLHVCKITEVVPGRKLSHSWRYDGYEGISYVTFELFPEGNKTRLKLTHTGLETLTGSPAFTRSNFVAGWDAIINTNLTKYLEKSGD